MKTTMNKIIKIWFDGEWLYGLGDDSKTYRQSLFYGINDCYMPTDAETLSAEKNW